MEDHNKNESAEGAENTPVSIDWSKIDPSQIPLDVLKKTDAYAEILSESIERRKKIKALQEQVEPPQKPEAVEPSADVADPLVKAITERFASLEEKLNNQLQALESAKQKTAKEAVMAQYQIPEELGQFITGSTPEELAQAAQVLSKNLRIGPEGNVGSGNASEDTDPITSMAKRIRDRLEGKAESNIFSPGTHRQSGGGTQAF